MPTDNKIPELLAPAGSRDAFTAAIDAGADAVYLGLNSLNARRGAENFTAPELPEIVSHAHERGVKVFLTLNTMVSCREAGTAARILQTAAESGIDAVLITDPMFIPLIKLFPKIAFHFSTQAAVENSAAVRAARSLGIARVVLARELSAGEIQACCNVSDIECEVFVQGALCFCVSGRCLLSSWGGGRSGNRGTCASPCRAIWSVNGKNPRRRMSMLDLAMLEHIKELSEMGVSCLKIEGRLKKAQWVAQAVSAYRRVLNGANPSELDESIERLGDYTGRGMTSGYFEGERNQMCGEAGRVTSMDSQAGNVPISAGMETKKAGCRYALDMKTASGRIECTVTCADAGDSVRNFSIPLTSVRKAKRSVAASSIEAHLKDTEISGYQFGSFTTDLPNRPMARRNVSAVVNETARILRAWKKRPAAAIQDIDLPADVRQLIKRRERNPANKIPLGSRVDTLRIDYKRIQMLGGLLLQFKRLIIENIPVGRGSLRNTIRNLPKGAVAALPAVFYEEEIENIKRLIDAAVNAGKTIEVNSWAGYQLVRDAGGTKYCGGPGMMILNHIAAKTLGELGFSSAYISIEADRKQIEALTKCSAIPLTLCVFGYPVLMYSRAGGKCFANEAILEDERRIKLRVFSLPSGLTVLRAAEPMSLLHIKNPAIKVASLAVDTVGVATSRHLMDLVKNLQHRRLPRLDEGIRVHGFNYNSSLA